MSVIANYRPEVIGLTVEIEPEHGGYFSYRAGTREDGTLRKHIFCSFDTLAEFNETADSIYKWAKSMPHHELEQQRFTLKQIQSMETTGTPLQTL